MPLPLLALVENDAAAGYLPFLLDYPNFVQSITDRAILAENEGLVEALDSYRTRTHRGVRAQQQLVYYLGQYLCGELGFDWDHVDSQGRFISPEDFSSAHYRIFCRRGRKIGSGFSISYRKGRTGDMMNENKTQISLFDDNDLPAVTAVKITAQSDIINVLVICELVDAFIDGQLFPNAELRVHLGIPTDYKNGVVSCSETHLIYSGNVGIETFGLATEENSSGSSDNNDVDLEEIDELQVASG